MKPRSTFLAWSIPAALVVAISVGLTIRQASSASAPERARFSGSRVVHAMPSLLASSQLPEPLRVAVVRDAAAVDYYGTPATLDTIVRAWRDALRAVGADARIVSPAELQRGVRARILVVPSSPCLTIATREALERAGARGQGLILTGTPGTHDAGCRRIGYGLLVAVTGASRAEPLRDRPMVSITVPYGGPLSIDVPPGARIDVHPGQQVALRGVPRDAYYSDYDLRPEPANGQPLLDGALTRATYRDARVVYWGFELRDVVDRPWSRDIVELLVRNSVAWAAGLPQASVEPWPNAHTAAAVIAQDVEFQFGNARHTADSLRAIGIPGTYFVATEMAHYYQGLTRELYRSGEVGSHTVDHSLLGGLPADEQHEHLRESQADLRSLIGRPASGLRPPEEQFDRATMEGWLAAGGTYLLGANDSRSAVPELLAFAQDTLVLIPRTGADDIAVIGRSFPEPEYIAARFGDDFMHLRALGGLYTLSYHSQLLARPDYLPVLAQMARRIAADSTVWVTTASDVARWWKARAQLKTMLTSTGGTQMEVTVRNPGAVPLRNIVVRVTLPPARAVANADATLLPAATGSARVFVRDLPPGTMRTIELTLTSDPMAAPN